jgi:hypothetical protein
METLMPARTTLTTVEEIKSRLRIPADQHDRDAEIDVYREAVEEDILALTGFTFKGGQHVDSLTDWQRGTTRLTSLRPVLALLNVEGRVLGTQATFNQLLGDVKNAYEGRILLVGYLNAFYDPRAGYGAAYGGGTWENWYKWREYTWPLVRLTYTADPLGSDTNPIPKALTVAALESVAWNLSRPAGSGAITSVSIEKVSESYGQGAKVGQLLAPNAYALLGRLIRGSVVMQT